MHRSVAFAHVAWYLLKASPRLELLPTFHASKRLWDMDDCGECSQCRARSAVRNEAFTKAMSVWCTMSPFQVM